ncbi:MAG: iron-containing alcohol dehydrogenase [Burkholderiales bacterium]|nr:MAG: iron-containing alcohol dehydrogenase [Burkholderiales bacterium]
MPRLSAFGIGEADLPRIIAHARGASMRTNPVSLTDGEMGQVLRERL